MHDEERVEAPDERTGGAGEVGPQRHRRKSGEPILDPDSPVLLLVPRTPVSVSATATLRGAAAALTEEAVGLALVSDGREFVGVISERDLSAALAGAADPDETRVGDVMTGEVISIPRDASILDAAWTMVGAEVRHLPIVDRQGNAVGVVSVRDVLRVLALHSSERSTGSGT